MNDVVLPGTGRLTSRFGFGGTPLNDGRSMTASLRLLDAAFEAGVRHYDVAPAYGLGSAESVLGTFIAKHKNDLTITSKFGLRPPASKHLLQFIRSSIKPMVSKVPGLKSRLVGLASAMNPAPRYSPSALRESLDASLRSLQCDFIDIFLLHEADVSDLTDELIRTLDGCVNQGLIGAWGLGSDRSKIDRIRALAIPTRVLQFEWSVLSPELPRYPGAFVVTHQALAGSLKCIKAKLSDPNRRDAWSSLVGADLGDDQILIQFLLAAALSANSGGIVLFSSHHVERVINNVAALQRANDAAVRLFVNLVTAEEK